MIFLRGTGWRTSNKQFDSSADPGHDPDPGLFNSFAADFLAPSAGKNIYVREIKLQRLTFVNTAITVANGTEGVLSTLVANGTVTVSTTVAISSERVKKGELHKCYVMFGVIRRSIFPGG